MNEQPIITSNGGGDSASVSIAENTSVVTKVVATDPDAGTTFSYSLSGGADQAKFQINASTGALSFITVPNFEVPSDADGNNTYIVQVRASDGNLSDIQTIAVNIADVVDRVQPADFNGNGTDDILWFNGDGRVAGWLVGGGQVTSVAPIGSAPTGWRFPGSGDINGNGTDDLLWLHDDGRVASWLINNGQVASATNIGSAPAGWHLAGISDVNGDAREDILWLNQDGRVASWLLNGNQVLVATTIGSAPAGWHFTGTGDVNGDHRDDISGCTTMAGLRLGY